MSRPGRIHFRFLIALTVVQIWVAWFNIAHLKLSFQQEREVIVVAQLTRGFKVEWIARYPVSIFAYESGICADHITTRFLERQIFSHRKSDRECERKEALMSNGYQR